jgi:DNA-binding GntR family transcriptional regulator
MSRLREVTKNGSARVSTSRQLYQALREEILTLNLAPGEPIDENGLAERYGVSRSPVREALIRLETDGLVRLTPNKGAIVTPLHLEEFPQYIEALDFVQRVVTRLAAINRSDSDIADIQQRNEEFKSAVVEHNVIRMIDANHGFHLAIGFAASNRYFTEIYKRLLDEGRRIIRLYFRSYNDDPPRDRVEAHQEIIDSIISQDADSADRLAHEHAMRLSQRFIAYLSTNRVADFRTDSLE